jgi:uncharacterized protein YpmB
VRMKDIKPARYGIITVLFICVCAGLSVGCQTHSQQVYSSQLNEIEAAKSKGELSTAEYIQLKHQAQNAHERRLAYDRFSIELITED